MKVKNIFDGLSRDWIWLRKDPVALKIGQSELPTVKYKDKI